MAKCSFKFRDVEYEIEPFTYGFAAKTLKEQLGINLLSAFQDDNLERLVTKILLDDEFALKCWWFFICKKDSPPDPGVAYERAIDDLTPKGMADFKDAFWAAITSFFEPTRREMLIQVRAGMKDLLLKAVQEQVKQALGSLSTSSQPEQDSVEQTPSLTA